MKIIAAVMAVLALIYFFPVFMSMSSGGIDGTSRETAYKSAIKLKRHLPTDERVLFDTAFGILDRLKSEEGPNAFAKAVANLEPEEVIELAQREVNNKIATGDPAFKQYASWEDMLYKLSDNGSDAPHASHRVDSGPSLRQSERPGRPK